MPPHLSFHTEGCDFESKGFFPEIEPRIRARRHSFSPHQGKIHEFLLFNLHHLGLNGHSFCHKLPKILYHP